MLKLALGPTTARHWPIRGSSPVNRFMFSAIRNFISSHNPLYNMASSSVPSEVGTWVDEKIANNRVVVFSKSYCPYCRSAKDFLKKNHPDNKALVYELDQVEEDRPDGQQIQDYLLQKTGQRTVPNIFIDTEHIGGSSDLRDKKDQVKELLSSAKSSAL